MRARRKTIYFHIGLERTGTTSLQHYCTRNVKRLLREGVLYPTRSTAFAHNNHAALAASYLPTDRPVDHHLRGDRQHRVGTVGALKAEIEASAAPVTLVSSEHLSSRFRQPQIEALARDFEAYDCKILVCLREHLALLSSSYATHIRSGSTDTFEDYAAMVCAPDSLYLRHAETLGMWEAAFGRDRMEVIGYAKDKDSTGALLARVGLRGPSGRPTLTCNQSLDPASTEALRMVNVALNARQDASLAECYVAFRRQDYIRSRLSDDLRQAANASAAWVLPDTHRSMLIELAETDRRRLAETYDIDLGPVDLAGIRGGDVERATAEHLAATLVRAVFERPPERALLASRGLVHALLEGVRRSRARGKSRLLTSE